MADELVATLEPHVYKLIQIVKLQLPDRSGGHSGLQTEMKDTLRDLLEQALLLKTKLDGSGYDYAFRWPVHASLLDRGTNPKYEVASALEPFHEVVSTLFPGIEVGGEIVRRADVVAHLRRAPTRQ